MRRSHVILRRRMKYSPSQLRVRGVAEVEGRRRPSIKRAKCVLHVVAEVQEDTAENGRRVCDGCWKCEQVLLKLCEPPPHAPRSAVDAGSEASSVSR